MYYFKFYFLHSNLKLCILFAISLQMEELELDNSKPFEIITGCVNCCIILPQHHKDNSFSPFNIYILFEMMYLSKACHTVPALKFIGPRTKFMDGPASPGPNNRLYHWGPWWTIPSYACLINKHASGQGYVKLCESNSEEIYRALCAMLSRYNAFI